jgi:hypothetical protein
VKKLLLIFIIIFIAIVTFAQDTITPKGYLNGYVKYMNTVMFEDVDDYYSIDNLIHNRLNFKWYINNNFTFATDVRTRLIYGDFVKMIPSYDSIVSYDNGYLSSLSNNLISTKSAVLTTTFDRLYLEYNKNNWVVTIGRQRINWGQSFAWNPNDIFNAYSYFDFDYEERPGSDALRVQYYPNFTSVAEAAIKIDRHKNITAAALYRFNKWGYDLQFLGGILDTTDFVVGAGWTGNIFNIGFNGEASYFHPQKSFSDTSGVFLVSAGLNYMFSNSLSFTFEGIYNGYFDKLNISSFNDIYFMPLSVKATSFSKFSWMGQVSYPIHPLLNASLAIMYFPTFGNSYFINPSFIYSAGNNFEIALFGQRFYGKFYGSEEKLNMLFLRFRVSF